MTDTTGTVEIPESIIEDFGIPDAWAVCTITVPESNDLHWRTMGYTSVLRSLESQLREKGKDVLSGEWRVYEFDYDLMGIEHDEVRCVVVVARDVKDAS